MKMSFNTTTSSATTPPRSAEAGVNASVSKGAPDSGTARNLLFSLPAPAQGTVANDATLAQDLAADLAEDGVSATVVAADITEAATKQDAGLPAMTPPLMAPMLPVLPQADAAAAPAKGNDGVAATQQGNAQQTLDLNSRLHPDALAFNVQTARMAPARDLGEPVAAAQPTPASAAGSKTALPAAPFDAAPAMTATPAAAAPVATRDGERSAATPVSPGPVGGVNNGAAATPGADTIKLNGPAQQWQEPLREALGERLQTQIGRNSEHATIRLDPPMLGRIEISIRHTAGALQVNVTASNSEVLRQLQGIGENMRSDLAQRQYTDVAVTISATPRSPAAQAFAEGDARGQRQPGRQNDDAEPGRALSDGSPAATTYAMHERDTA
ncbi:flagellar hook-length control protein FliK [Janthinobacterium sp. SUN073]|uniref:flagellar hook-length control protein FliK n=1 Tax=Janthinobacterium sp. SUN073 TaxID=3004102 RepID=UPI0025B1391C|nr:flagellar hook-length control protein FliK [Janthinobacterium sp. SUN073]MDN2697317.1 flagellar hook-length control protein FliK [Janthinobacterium sp. SUN073]